MGNGRRYGRRKRRAAQAVWCGLIVSIAYVAGCTKGSGRRADGGANDSAADSAKSTAGAAARPSAGTPSPSGRKKLLFVGTSLTAGLGLDPDSAYPMMIERKIAAEGLPYDVTNAGVSGETSSGLLDRLDWLLRGDPDVLVLETGANDGLRGIPVATLRANLDTALDRIRAKLPRTRVLLVQMEALPNLGPKYAADFHNTYPAVAKAKGVTLLPFLLQDVAGKRELNQGDGVHPNNRGERMVAEHLWGALGPILRAAGGSPRRPLDGGGNSG